MLDFDCCPPRISERDEMLATSIKIVWNKTGTAVRRPPAIAAAVDAVLAPDDVELDYTDAKLSLDVLIDGTIDVPATRSAIEQLAAIARHMAGPTASPNARLVALRRLLYEAGSWNEHLPFAYDHPDPLGQNIANKILTKYLTTRRGNCVSMPILFLILADRLDLDVTLAKVPLHFLARYRDEDGRTIKH